MLKRLTDFIHQEFFRQLPADYAADFYRDRLSSNLLKCIFIGRLCLGFFVLLIILDLWRWQAGEMIVQPVYVWIMGGHLLVGLASIPHFIILRNQDEIRRRVYPVRKGEQLLSATIFSISLATIFIVLFAIYERNSLAVYGVLLLIINFLISPAPHTLIQSNLFLFLIILFGGIFLAGKTGTKAFVYALEVCAFAGPVFVGSVFQYNQRVKSFLYEKELESKNAIIEQALTEKFERQIAEIEMSALRAQMNPHFLFNALNSIKLYVVSNDSETAALYLTKFSKLIRLILNNSKQQFVSLDKELQALELYIQMEQFRFNFIFDYEIITEPEVDKDFTEIPPMLLQPYVENAIWHGLMHKHDGKGLLTIHISSESGELRFVIEDNGIGREASMRLKSKTRTKHESVGMKITADRLAMANRLYGTEGRLQVIDKVNEKGKAQGTKVVFSLPYDD